MTTNRDPDRILRAWLDLMPDEAPDRLVNAVLEVVETTPQQRRPIGLSVWRLIPMPHVASSTARVGLALLLLLALTSLAFLVSGSLRPSLTLPRGADAFEPVGNLPEKYIVADAVRLDDGRVLMTGLFPGLDPGDWHARIWDPVSRAQTEVGVRNPSVPLGPTTVLADGRVLILRDRINLTGPASSEIELFAPKTQTWTPAGSTLRPRDAGRVVALPDGRALFVGGLDRLVNGADVQWGAAEATTETYDPETGAFALAGNLAEGRSDAAVVVLADGRVLAAGGSGGDLGDIPLKSAEVFDPASGTWSAVGSLRVATTPIAAVRLPDARILVVYDSGRGWASDVFDPTTNTFSPGADIPTPPSSPDTRTRTSFTVSSATALADGRVLLVGMWQRRTGVLPHPSSDGSFGWAAIYDPAVGIVRRLTPDSAVADRRAVGLLDGSVLLVGGDNADGGGPASLLEVFR